MNFFFCNQYESKNEDIYMITPKMPFDKNNSISNNNLKSLKNNYKLFKIENEKNNISKGNDIEESDELQIIDYPYQPHQIYYNINTLCNNKSKRKTSSVEFKNFSIFNYYNNSINNTKFFYEDKIIKDINKMKNSFSCLSNPNIDNINNSNCYKKLDIDELDNIKGEDNINISKLKI